MWLNKYFPETREDKVRMVIQLHKMGKNVRYISKKVHLSFSDIGAITRKFFGDDEQRLSKKYSKHSQALQLFQKGHTKLQVAIELGLTDSEIIKEYKQYMVLNGFDGFCEMYDGMAGDMGSYIFLHHELKSAGINVRDAIEGIKVAWQLNQLKTERDGLLAENVGLKSEIYTSSNELEDLKREKNALLGVLAEARVEVLNEIADRDRIQDDHTRVRRGRFRDTQNSSPNKRDLHVNK